MRSAKSSPKALGLDRPVLDTSESPSTYAARCSIRNRPPSSPVSRPRITFSAGSNHAKPRSPGSDRARRARSSVTRDATANVPSPPACAPQGETSAKSQFDLLISRRAAHHDAVQASWQPVEAKPKVNVSQEITACVVLHKRKVHLLPHVVHVISSRKEAASLSIPFAGKVQNSHSGSCSDTIAP